MYMITIPQRHRQTDGQADGQTDGRKKCLLATPRQLRAVKRMMSELCQDYKQTVESVFF